MPAHSLCCCYLIAFGCYLIAQPLLPARSKLSDAVHSCHGPQPFSLLATLRYGSIRAPCGTWAASTGRSRFAVRLPSVTPSPPPALLHHLSHHLSRQFFVWPGFRIELGEIEADARAMWDEPVDVAVVVVDDELVLFVPANAVLGKSELRAHCARRLPPYMVPSRVIALASFPRLVSGKIDMGALQRGEHAGEMIESAFARVPTEAICMKQMLHSVVSNSIDVAIYRLPAKGFLHTLVKDHVVHGEVVFPATGYLAVVHSAAEASHVLKSTYFLQPLFFDSLLASNSPDVFVEYSVTGGRFDVRSDVGACSTVHCAGTVLRADGSPWHRIDHGRLRNYACGHPADVVVLYDKLHAAGMQYGPSYRTLELVWGSMGRSSMAAARLHVRTTQQGVDVHPADLDDALCLDQLLPIGPGTMSGSGGDGSPRETRLPFAVDAARLRGAPGQQWAVCATPPPCAHKHPTRGRSLSACVALLLTRGCACVRASGCTSVCCRSWSLMAPRQCRWGLARMAATRRRSSTASSRARCVVRR